MSGVQQSPNEAEIARAWEYHKAADELLAVRFSYALVAHSMALAAYATVISQKGVLFVAAVVSAFGLFFSFVQFMITKGMADKVYVLKEVYLKHDPIYLLYNQTGKRFRHLQTVIVPVVLAAVWLTLFIFTLFQMPPICSA